MRFLDPRTALQIVGCPMRRLVGVRLRRDLATHLGLGKVGFRTPLRTFGQGMNSDLRECPFIRSVVEGEALATLVVNKLRGI